MHQLLHHLRTPVSQSWMNSRTQEMLKMRLLVLLTNRLQNLDQRLTSASVEELLLKPQLLKGVAQLSPKSQTSTLEAKHSLDIQFVPKHTAFSYWGIYSRFDYFPYQLLHCFSYLQMLQITKLQKLALISSLIKSFIRLWLSALHYNTRQDAGSNRR